MIRVETPGKTGMKKDPRVAMITALKRPAGETCMRPRTLMLDGVTKRERNLVTMELRDAVSAAGGWIEAENFFSNIAVAFRFFIKQDGFSILRAAIEQSDVRLDTESLERLANAISAPPSHDQEMACALNVTFSHNEPDMRREVPAVPG
jgi:hypothetical protein